MSNCWTDLRGKVAIVYGGSYGIGGGISEALSNSGASVVIVARNKTRGLEAVNELRTPGLFVQGDVAIYENHSHIVNETISKCGRIDMIVCCAGLYPNMQIDSKDFDDDYIGRMIDVNLKGCVYAVKATLPYLKMHHQEDGARVIFISSATGTFTGLVGRSLYGATKAGQIGFARSAALELAPFNMRVHCILPGWCVSEDPLTTHKPIKDRPGHVLQSLDTTTDISDAVIHLLKKESSCILWQSLSAKGERVLEENLISERSDEV